MSRTFTTIFHTNKLFDSQDASESFHQGISEQYQVKKWNAINHEKKNE